MGKVIAPPGDDVSLIQRDGSQGPLAVRSVVAEHEQGHVISLLIDVYRERSQGPLHFVLSPSGASQLARELRKAVKAYMRHTPNTDE